MSDQEEMVRTPLSEVLSSEADQVIVDEQVEPEQTQEPEATETVDQKAAPTAEETTPEVSEVDKLRKEMNAYKTKAYDELNKRQVLQRENEEYKKQPVEKPDAFVNPDEAISHGNNEIRAEFNDRFLNMSESQARGRHGDDFDQMKDTFFNELVIDNPVLSQQAMQAPDPYEFVYQQAKTHDELKDVGSLSDYRTKIENEMRAKFEAEYAGKAADATEQAISNALPGTLSTATATGGNQTPTWGGPPTLDTILGKK
ncbi:MAG: hypothetical protein V3T88_07190 [Nitrosomonadaceae bacterium]